jgi:hypothetical protein
VVIIKAMMAAEEEVKIITEIKVRRETRMRLSE